MSHWNYRILEDADSARIIEMHYDDNGTPWGWSEASPVGNGYSDLRGEIEHMMGAFDREPIKTKDLPKVITGQVPKRAHV